MGLTRLEWHEGKNGAWVARVAIHRDDSETRYGRFADVNLLDWVGYITRQQHKGKVPVLFTPVHYGAETIWFDSIEAAKLHVEAVFALDYN